MNQILQESLNPIINDYYNRDKKEISQFFSWKQNQANRKKKFYVEFSNEIAEIPYGGNYNISMHPKWKSFKTFIKERKYQLQFFISVIIAIIFLIFLFWKLHQNQQQEKIAKELLNNYQLSTLYSTNEQYNTSKSNTSITVENPFVIGMIKIDKIQLSYSILSEANDDLLKVSVCRFAGPMPNETGNLCIVGHNYLDSRFFGRLDELNIGDKIEIYGLSGQMQEYTIFGKDIIQENDLSCTDQNVGDNKIVTLVTCDNLDSSKRLVLQAKQEV